MKGLTIRRILPASVARVFATWSSGEAMSRWFVCEPGWTAHAESDFRVGGSYSVEMRNGARTVSAITGEYVEIDPPRKLVFTWNNEYVRDSRVTIELAPGGSQRRTARSAHTSSSASQWASVTRMVSTASAGTLDKADV